MRTFVAVDIPDRLTDPIAEVQAHLKESGASVRWVDVSSLHFTVKFLGELSDREVADVDAALGRVARDARPTSARVAGVGCFPHRRRPRVVWIGVEEDGDALAALAAAVEDAMAELGFDREKREFHPHVTLGRVKGGKRIDHLVEAMDAVADVRIGEIEIDELVLFESILSPSGAQYEPVSTYSLGGSPGG